MPVHPTSILFVTLDSCRYDTFATAKTPNFDRVGELHRAMAPGSFTFSSHSAMFMGHTPGVAGVHEPYTNPRYGQIFRLAGGGTGLAPFVSLKGRNIIDGLSRIGYLTVGVGAMRWFNPETLTSRTLVFAFDKFFYSGNQYSLRAQLEFIRTTIAGVQRPVFVFINVGETHTPYFHEGADWSYDDNPCRELADDNDADECRRRQTACLEWVDTEMAGMLDLFAGANTLVCADHGDAWGEDGLWTHGFFHEKVLEVPLLHRLQNRPVNPRRPTKRAGSTDKVANSIADTARNVDRRLRRFAQR
ncbi:MAG: hypothetical protein WAM97_16395 [Acidimicrobiales bacterium]|jgi:hypothetical protein